MRVFLVAGSPATQKPAVLAPGPADRVIAADYGAHHARAWGWPIHLLVGDLDSLPAADLRAVQAAGIPVITAPAAKDETDLELALAHALAGGAQEVILCAALGGRADHMLANIFLLARPDLAEVTTVIAEGAQTVRLLRGGSQDAETGIFHVRDVEHPERRASRGRWPAVEGGGAAACLTLSGAAGDLLTLLPLAGDAGGVTTAGLRYPLADETLVFGQARGVSNVFDADVAQIWLRRGLLLVIHTQNGSELRDSGGGK